MMLHAGMLGAGVLHKVQGVVSCPKRLTFDGHVFASKIIPKYPVQPLTTVIGKLGFERQNNSYETNTGTLVTLSEGYLEG